MFPSFEELESHDVGGKVSAIRRLVYYACIAIVSAIVFGALYLGIRFLE